MEGQRTREGVPLQKRRSDEEILGHRSPGLGIRDSEEGYCPEMLKVGRGFPRRETEPCIGAGHTPLLAKAPRDCSCPWGARSVLTRDPKKIFFGLQDAGRLSPTPAPPREGMGADRVPHSGSARLGAPAVFGH